MADYKAFVKDVLKDIEINNNDAGQKKIKLIGNLQQLDKEKEKEKSTLFISQNLVNDYELRREHIRAQIEVKLKQRNALENLNNVLRVNLKLQKRLVQGIQTIDFERLLELEQHYYDKLLGESVSFNEAQLKNIKELKGKIIFSRPFNENVKKLELLQNLQNKMQNAKKQFNEDIEKYKTKLKRNKSYHQNILIDLIKHSKLIFDLNESIKKPNSELDILKRKLLENDKSINESQNKIICLRAQIEELQRKKAKEIDRTPNKISHIDVFKVPLSPIRKKTSSKSVSPPAFKRKVDKVADGTKCLLADMKFLRKIKEVKKLNEKHKPLHSDIVNEIQNSEISETHSSSIDIQKDVVMSPATQITESINSANTINSISTNSENLQAEIAIDMNIIEKSISDTASANEDTDKFTTSSALILKDRATDIVTESKSRTRKPKNNIEEIKVNSSKEPGSNYTKTKSKDVSLSELESIAEKNLDEDGSGKSENSDLSSSSSGKTTKKGSKNVKTTKQVSFSLESEDKQQKRRRSLPQFPSKNNKEPELDSILFSSQPTTSKKGKNSQKFPNTDKPLLVSKTKSTPSTSAGFDDLQQQFPDISDFTFENMGDMVGMGNTDFFSYQNNITILDEPGTSDDSGEDFSMDILKSLQSKLKSIQSNDSSSE